MKVQLSAAALLASAIGTEAFVSPSNNAFPASALRMADTPMNDDAVAPVSSSIEMEEPEMETTTPPAPVLPKMSQALPFAERPAMLDGSLVGDVGFDPLGFAKNQQDLMNYREAEIKHARLAMLAAAGWPLSELFDKKLAVWAGMSPLVDVHDRAPSVLNGGLGRVSPAYWAACLLAAGAIDLYGINQAKANEPGYFPGNLGFDPLGLYPKDEAGQKQMRLKEIKNGRLAMMAITGFAIQEFVSKLGVVDETPLFFKPLGTVLHDYANSGYIVPN